MSTEKTHYTVTEAAKELDVPKPTLHTWIQQGKVVTDGRFGISKQSPYRIHRDEIDRIRRAMATAS
ncbi:MAG: helix-turn-helix domain-containing protein [Anaerolineae bacterium]|nr:helix-turn-helix domain-containing protein [Anaerolineae bacterium]MCO5192437.1 helix-turn-helix domain-containing protein [Anaerolineae bacterium]MCO5203441.1 helix-turn-helix domain-containing protein [Anaerolineae bacterium]